MSTVSVQFKIDYYESMNTVLIQEVLRYNNLLQVLASSLKDLIKATQGLIVMSPELDTYQSNPIHMIVSASPSSTTPSRSTGATSPTPPSSRSPTTGKTCGHVWPCSCNG